MISHVGMPEADSSGTVSVMGMVTCVVFMDCVKNLCSYGRLSCWDEGCKSGEGGFCLTGVYVTVQTSRERSTITATVISAKAGIHRGEGVPLINSEQLRVYRLYCQTARTQ